MTWETAIRDGIVSEGSAFAGLAPLDIDRLYAGGGAELEVLVKFRADFDAQQTLRVAQLAVLPIERYEMIRCVYAFPGKH